MGLDDESNRARLALPVASERAAALTQREFQVLYGFSVTFLTVLVVFTYTFWKPPSLPQNPTVQTSTVDFRMPDPMLKLSPRPSTHPRLKIQPPPPKASARHVFTPSTLSAVKPIPPLPKALNQGQRKKSRLAGLAQPRPDFSPFAVPVFQRAKVP
ncbi:hypothetical protein [Anthocerotibacter panamensis]|uniref:hypothetical protein n=1 Tax=Anthocerotibacter panamensis TaxID=2857077 RepID=UPI001C407554|nr:hypothetical protein [Anthocerotibacter panamensis]